MNSYHVYFNGAPGVSTEDLAGQVRDFMNHQLSANHAIGYRLIEISDKGSFKEMPGFHLIVDYATELDLKTAFENMKGTYLEEPHRSLMTMVSGMRVAFSADLLEARLPRIIGQGPPSR